MTGAFIFAASLVPLALWAGILALEARRGERFFPHLRDTVDDLVVAVSAALASVHLPSLVRTAAGKGARKVVHDLATGALALVRAIERLLTRSVRHLRRRRAEEEGVAPSSHIVAMREAKDGASRTPVPPFS